MNPMNLMTNESNDSDESNDSNDSDESNGSNDSNKSNDFNELLDALDMATLCWLTRYDISLNLVQTYESFMVERRTPGLRTTIFWRPTMTFSPKDMKG